MDAGEVVHATGQAVQLLDNHHVELASPGVVKQFKDAVGVSLFDVCPQFLSSFEFVSGVGCALLGG